MEYAMRNIALTLALCATTLLWATACESGTSGPSGSSNSWQQPSADAGSSDSGNVQADASNQPDQQVTPPACVFAKIDTSKTWKCSPCQDMPQVYDTQFTVNTKKCTLDTNGSGVFKSDELALYNDAPPPVTIKLVSQQDSNVQYCCVEAQ